MKGLFTTPKVAYMAMYRVKGSAMWRATPFRAAKEKAVELAKKGEAVFIRVYEVDANYHDYKI